MCIQRQFTLWRVIHQPSYTSFRMDWETQRGRNLAAGADGIGPSMSAARTTQTSLIPSSKRIWRDVRTKKLLFAGGVITSRMTVTRMSWTLTSDFWQASHPPVPIVDGHQSPTSITRNVKSGDVVVLDAGQSYNPDHPKDNSQLEFQWYRYMEPTIGHPIGAEAVPRCTIRPLSPPSSGTKCILPYNDCGFENVVLGPRVEVIVPNSKQPALFGLPAQHWLPHTGISGMAYHIILQVSNKNAKFPVRRYLRIILDAGLS